MKNKMEIFEIDGDNGDKIYLVRVPKDLAFSGPMGAFARLIQGNNHFLRVLYPAHLFKYLLARAEAAQARNELRYVPLREQTPNYVLSFFTKKVTFTPKDAQDLERLKVLWNELCLSNPHPIVVVPPALTLYARIYAFAGRMGESARAWMNRARQWHPSWPGLRFKKQVPSYGARRTRTAFLWWPKIIEDESDKATEMRWLCKTSWREEYRGFVSKWVPQGWDERYDWDNDGDDIFGDK